MALVKNLIGTTDNNPPVGYSSWREFWEANMYRRFSVCSCVTCSNKAEVGGHVKKVFGSGEWYIVPICYTHNNPSNVDPYEVADSDLLRVRL